MTERKPLGVSFESWIDKQIRDAEARGEFTDLPGAGKPLPNLHRSDGELWWIKEKMKSEGFPTDALLPTSLKLRKEIDQLPDKIRNLHAEQEVRDAVVDLNQRIMQHLRAPSGPQVAVYPVDVDEAITQWRAVGLVSNIESEAKTDQQDQAPRQARWWHRILGKRSKVD